MDRQGQPARSSRIRASHYTGGFDATSAPEGFTGAVTDTRVASIQNAARHNRATSSSFLAHRAVNLGERFGEDGLIET